MVYQFNEREGPKEMSLFEGLTPDDLQAEAEAIVQEIKHTPVAIAKEKAMELTQYVDQYEKAKKLVKMVDELKSSLADYCEENNITSIEVGDRCYSVVKSVPESYETKTGFATQLFKLDHPKLYAKYESTITEKKNGRKAYLREVKR